MKEKMKSYSERMEDNIKEVTYYLDVARSIVIEKYSEEYMEAHPELVASLVQSIVIKDLESTLMVLKKCGE